MKTIDKVQGTNGVRFNSKGICQFTLDKGSMVDHGNFTASGLNFCKKGK